MAGGIVDQRDDSGVEFVLYGEHGETVARATANRKALPMDQDGQAEIPQLVGNARARLALWRLSSILSEQDHDRGDASMKAPFVAIAAALALSACVDPVITTTGGPAEPRSNGDAGSLSGSTSVRTFAAVVDRVEPVAERLCRAETRGVNCDFNIVVDTNPRLPPNAFQTLDERGRPVIGFTASLIREMRNADEIAFALSHEAAHHIEGHIPQTQSSAVTGALIGTVLGSLAGLDAQGVEAAQRIGGTVGARRFSKDFELEADVLGARIARQAGFDPVRGVQYFARAPDPGDQFLGTHPPNRDRIDAVRRVAAGG